MIRDDLTQTDGGISPVAGVILMLAVTVSVLVIFVSAFLLIPIALANFVNVVQYSSVIVGLFVGLYVLQYLYMFYKQRTTEFEDILSLEEDAGVYKAKITNLSSKVVLGENLIVAPVGTDPRDWEFAAVLHPEDGSTELTFKEHKESEDSEDDDSVFVAGEVYGVRNATFDELDGLVVYDTEYEEVDRIE